MIPLYSPNQARLPTAVAIGSFDGLHAGHRKVIETIRKDTIAIPTVVSFWPHPREVLFGECRLRIDLPSEKTDLLEPLGIKQLVLIPFDASLANLRPEEFVHKILIKTLHSQHISIGEDFRFGKKREGTALALKELAEVHGVEVTIVPILKDVEGRMSSSRIRSALNDGDLQIAKTLMGRPYRFQGKVIKGKGLGKKLGWPTANLEVDGRKLLPRTGVYACWAWLMASNKPYSAVMNLGPQPTVDPTSPSGVEVHLLDQQIDLNGMELIVEPIKRLRGQKKFSSLKELSSQIGLDTNSANEIFDMENIPTQ